MGVANTETETERPCRASLKSGGGAAAARKAGPTVMPTDARVQRLPAAAAAAGSHPISEK